MANYRIYFLDETGHVFEGQNYEAEDDLSVLERATALSENRSVEVWQASRCVAKIARGGDNAVASPSV